MKIAHINICNAEAGGKLPQNIRQPDWELLTLDWVDQPQASVRSFVIFDKHTRYEVQLTQREFFRKNIQYDGDTSGKEQVIDPAQAYTLTVWGFSHEDCYNTPSVGRTYRWTDHDHIHGPDFANKMGLLDVDADSLLGVLQSLNHSVRLCSEVPHG